MFYIHILCNLVYMAYFMLHKLYIINFIRYIYTATAAKSLQSCLTLCNPVDGSPPGSTVPGIRPLYKCLNSFNSYNYS